MNIVKQLPPLNNETIWQIIEEKLSDDIANQLVWYHLGYRYNFDTKTWDNCQVEESWREEYPTPPDFIENRPPTVRLTRSIPSENKQLLKEELGFQGYKIGEFTPRHTRRATMANWLLSHQKLTTKN